MTVKELRTILLTYPDEMEVGFVDAEWGPTAAQGVEVSRIETGKQMLVWRELVSGTGRKQVHEKETRDVLVLT